MDKSTFTDVNTLSPMERNKNSEKNITIYIEIVGTKNLINDQIIAL